MVTGTKVQFLNKQDVFVEHSGPEGVIQGQRVMVTWWSMLVSSESA